MMRLVSSVPRASAGSEVDAKPQCKQLLLHAGVARQGRMNNGAFPFKFSP